MPQARALVVIALLLSSAAARSDEGQRAAELLVRVLAYDGAAGERSGETVAIGVLFNPGDPGSVTAQEQLVAALGKLAATQKVGGKALAAAPLALPAGRAPGAVLGGTRLTALYVCAGLDSAVPAIAEFSRGRSVLSFTGTADQAGIAVTLLQEGGKLRMLIDTGAASAQGARLAPALLKLAEIVGGSASEGPETSSDPDQPVRLKSSMTPPKPVPASMKSPAYPPSLRAAHVAGRVVLLLEVRRDGTVGKVEARSGHPGLAEAASAAVKAWRFEPALQEGKPVAVWLPYPIDFKLD